MLRVPGARHMPCFLITYHAHGTWLPNRKQGYVKRGQGILPPDERTYRLYVGAMTQEIACFDDDLQKGLIHAALEAAPYQRFELYYVASDVSHLHVLLGWRHDRQGKLVKSQLKWSLTHALNIRFEKRTWLVGGGSGKQVKDLAHFHYLRNVYLPEHNGWKWSPDRGLFM